MTCSYDLLQNKASNTSKKFQPHFILKNTDYIISNNVSLWNSQIALIQLLLFISVLCYNDLNDKMEMTMIYKLFTEFITLQALLKELGIIQSGGAIKEFLAETTVLFNGEDEKRRGKKIRVGDKISLPDQDLIIIIVEPSQEEKEQFAEEMAEKTRVAALVKQMNQANKKTSSKHNNRQSTTKKSLRATKKTKGKPTAPVRFPGI